MAKITKYDTIEEVVAATGVELNDKTRSFLESFVKKVVGATSEAKSAKKQSLLDSAELFGVTGIDAEKENVATLQIKIITHLFENGQAEEMKEFAASQNLFVTDEGHIHHVRQAVKPIQERNAGVKKDSVGYNTIQLLKDPEYANLTAAELAAKQAEVYGQPTTSACIQWYINYCNKKKAAATTPEDIEKFTIVDRKHAARSSKAVEGGIILGAELTMDKATKPKGFAKKAAPAAADLGDEMNLPA